MCKFEIRRRSFNSNESCSSDDDNCEIINSAGFDINSNHATNVFIRAEVERLERHERYQNVQLSVNLPVVRVVVHGAAVEPIMEPELEDTVEGASQPKEVSLRAPHAEGQLFQDESRSDEDRDDELLRLPPDDSPVPQPVPRRLAPHELG